MDCFRHQKPAIRFDEKWQLPEVKADLEQTDKIRQIKVKQVEMILEQLPEIYAQVLRLRFLNNLSVKKTV